MISQKYLRKLSPLKSAKIQKITFYYQFLNTLSDTENQSISDDFYQNHPLFTNQKLLKEILQSFKEKEIAPDTNFVEALDDYFRVKVENC